MRVAECKVFLLRSCLARYPQKKDKQASLKKKQQSLVTVSSIVEVGAIFCRCGGRNVKYCVADLCFEYLNA